MHAAHRWNSSSSALSALLFLILKTSNLLSIVLFRIVESLECSVQRAQQTRRREGKKALNLGFIFRPQTIYNTSTKGWIVPLSAFRFWREICILLYKPLKRKINWQMKLTSNVSRGAWRTRACSMEKQMVIRSGFSLVWRRRNQPLAG